MKRLLLVLIFFITSLSVYAQMGIGFRGGVNFGQLYLGPRYNLDYQNYQQGYNFGVVFRHYQQWFAGVQVEVNYTQIGWNLTSYLYEINPDLVDYISNTKKNIDYIQVPFMSHFVIGKGKTKGIINAGPYLAYAIGVTNFFNDQGLVTKQKGEFDEQTYQRFNYGIQAAAGVQREFPFGILALEFRFSAGLMDVRKPLEIVSSLESLPEVFGGSLTYFLPLWGKKKEVTNIGD